MKFFEPEMWKKEWKSNLQKIYNEKDFAKNKLLTCLEKALPFGTPSIKAMMQHFLFFFYGA